MRKDQELLQPKTFNIQRLYNVYAGMLLGYIFETVRDKQLAEKYLVKIFSTIANNFAEINWGEGSTWCRLQRFTKNQLADFIKTANDCEIYITTKNIQPNKYLDRMTGEQRLVFCSFYHTRKNAAELSAELNMCEILIKKLLKEAFIIIRKSHDS